MDIRTTPNPLVRRAGRTLHTLNSRHPWDHNAHFHRWILRSLPTPTRRVLDVGCGRGALVRALAAHLAADGTGTVDGMNAADGTGAADGTNTAVGTGATVRVDGIDPDEEMARIAAEACADLPGVQIQRRGLAEHAAQLRKDAPGGTYDAVTMIASLHHMDLEPALEDARDLLRPGGRLLVVTLTVPRTRTDLLWDVGNALTNPLIGLALHPRPVRDPAPGPLIPVRDPAWSVGELRERASAVLPGAVVRRREGFRSTLRWQKPA